jgi:uncharacterized protein (DUF1778 family)
MAVLKSAKKTLNAHSSKSLIVRLDQESKRSLSEAAQLRQMSMSDYVRTVTVAQARREVTAARKQVLSLTPEEQSAFWNALNEPPKLTRAQRRLGRLMRGNS